MQNKSTILRHFKLVWIDSADDRHGDDDDDDDDNDDEADVDADSVVKLAIHCIWIIELD